MTYDEWFLSKQGEPYDCMYTFARDAWNAAVEQAAAICDERAMACERKTVTAEDADDVTELRSAAWKYSVLAAEVRKTSFNAKSQATDAALSRQVACTDGLCPGASSEN